MSRADNRTPGMGYVSMSHTYFATVSLVWFAIVWSVCAIGVIQLYASSRDNDVSAQILT